MHDAGPDDSTPRLFRLGKGIQVPGSKGDGAKSGDATAAAIKEATQLLQSMKISRLENIRAVTQIKDLGEGRRRKGLIDGGATACLRTAKSSERCLPTLNVELALLELGFRIDWSKENSIVTHHTRGQLLVDATSGCPEIEYETALQLISEYEEHVKNRDTHEARARCLLLDMNEGSNDQLAATMWGGGVEAAVAMRLLASRLFPDTPPELLKQVGAQGLGLCFCLAFRAWAFCTTWCRALTLLVASSTYPALLRAISIMTKLAGLSKAAS